MADQSVTYSEQQERAHSEFPPQNAANASSRQQAQEQSFVENITCTTRKVNEKHRLSEVGQKSSTADIGPRDYQNLYRNAQNSPAPKKLTDFKLADFVLEYVADFISHQENKYRR